MFEVKVHNYKTNRSYGARFNSLDEANLWIDCCISKQSWGKSERTIEKQSGEVFEIDDIIEEFDEVYGDVIIPMVKLKCEYSIDINDLSDDYDYLLQECYRKRIEGYGPLGDQMDMMYKDMDAWKTHIETVKNLYPKPIKE